MPLDTVDRLRSALADRYTIEREIGHGGNATVYLALDRKHKRKVAVKVLLPELALSVRTERFLQEIEIAAGLTHPHILPLHDSGEAQGFLYYVMPYVAGESLRERLTREQQLPVAEALRITRDVAEAVGYAHSHGVVHRDIKPENILLSEGGAVVADFGIARALSEAGGSSVTATGIAVGTPLYMSPEQAGGSKTLDGRSDIYSLGCVVYEMLAGGPPFTGETPQEILAQHALEPVPRLRKVRPAVAAGIDLAIQQALAKRPAERFATVAEFAAALVAVPSLAVRLWSGTRPRRRAAVVSAVLAMLVTGGWFAAQRAMHPRPGRVHDAAWARAVGIPMIRRLMEDGNLDSAWAVARAAARLIPNDSTLGTVWPQIANRVTIETDPPDAKVYRSPYGAASDSDYLGTTPIADAWLPRQTLSRLRFERDGYEAAEQTFMYTGVVSGGAESQDARDIRIKLFPSSEVPSGFVYVPGVSYRPNVSGLEHAPAVELRDYFIDRYEVTNRQYKQFVAAGGYRDRRYWQEPFLMEGHALSWGEAMARFVDRTSRPGPATWEAGDYLEGQDEYPVGGVSWYEAAAYALFAGKSLPTIYHWARAAGGAAAPWIVPRSNFAGQGPARVGTYLGMSQFGAYDMAGNVREWCVNRSEDRRYILGGGWNDATYLFNFAATESPWDRSPANGIRLVSYSDKRDPDRAAQPILLPRRDFYTEQPANDQTFNIYRRAFDYDQAPLGATVDERDSTDTRWIRERVSFTAAYGNERVLAFLFLPRASKPPYQTVVYFPGAGALLSRSSKNIGSFVGTTVGLVNQTGNIDVIVKSGRALLFPVYKSTYERGDDLKSIIENESNAYKEHIIMWAKDLRRAVDYAETRPELDVRKLAYLGQSWGAATGPIWIVVEPRIKVAILNLAGLRAQRAQPEADVFNYVSRVRIPVLLLSGRYDPLFPLETSARPFFRLLGTDSTRKRQVISDGGHFTPRPLMIRETLDWLDRYVGPVKR